MPHTFLLNARRSTLALMKIGILGTGDVGRVLGAACVTLRHDVMMGPREPEYFNTKNGNHGFKLLRK
jgi:hypothetical protein